MKSNSTRFLVSVVLIFSREDAVKQLLSNVLAVLQARARRCVGVASSVTWSIVALLTANKSHFNQELSHSPLPCANGGTIAFMRWLLYVRQQCCALPQILSRHHCEQSHSLQLHDTSRSDITPELYQYSRRVTRLKNRPFLSAPALFPFVRPSKDSTSRENFTATIPILKACKMEQNGGWGPRQKSGKGKERRV